MIELDFEVKGKKSIYSDQVSVYEKHRQLLVGVKREIKKGYFTRERNITQALRKHGGVPEIEKSKDAENNQYQSNQSKKSGEEGAAGNLDDEHD